MITPGFITPEEAAELNQLIDQVRALTQVSAVGSMTEFALADDRRVTSGAGGDGGGAGPNDCILVIGEVCEPSSPPPSLQLGKWKICAPGLTAEYLGCFDIRECGDELCEDGGGGGDPPGNCLPEDPPAALCLTIDPPTAATCTGDEADRQFRLENITGGSPTAPRHVWIHGANVGECIAFCDSRVTSGEYPCFEFMRLSCDDVNPGYALFVEGLYVPSGQSVPAQFGVYSRPLLLGTDPMYLEGTITFPDDTTLDYVINEGPCDGSSTGPNYPDACFQAFPCAENKICFNDVMALVGCHDEDPDDPYTSQVFQINVNNGGWQDLDGVAGGTDDGEGFGTFTPTTPAYSYGDIFCFRYTLTTATMTDTHTNAENCDPADNAQYCMIFSDCPPPPPTTSPPPLPPPPSPPGGPPPPPSPLPPPPSPPVPPSP